MSIISNDELSAALGMLTSILPPELSCALVVFEKDKPVKKVSYISAADRNKSGYAMRLLLKKWDEADALTEMARKNDTNSKRAIPAGHGLVICGNCDTRNCRNNGTCISCSRELIIE